MFNNETLYKMEDITLGFKSFQRGRSSFLIGVNERHMDRVRTAVPLKICLFKGVMKTNPLDIHYSINTKQMISEKIDGLLRMVRSNEIKSKFKSLK